MNCGHFMQIFIGGETGEETVGEAVGGAVAVTGALFKVPLLAFHK